MVAVATASVATAAMSTAAMAPAAMAPATPAVSAEPATPAVETRSATGTEPSETTPESETATVEAGPVPPIRVEATAAGNELNGLDGRTCSDRRVADRERLGGSCKRQSAHDAVSQHAQLHSMISVSRQMPIQADLAL